MMSIFNKPYPKSSVLKFLRFLAVMCFMISFILIVFQPFGTAGFSHPYKYWILAGYGIVIFASGSLFFSLVDRVLSDASKDRWTIGYEIVLLFGTIFISQCACFFYWVWLFSAGISLIIFINFLIVATSVSILPIGFYLLHIYQKYRDVQHAMSTTNILHLDQESTELSSENNPLSENQDDNTVNIIGTGKKEKYEFLTDCIRLIVAEDNYVIIYSVENHKLKKWMIRATMNEVENQLNKNFLRIHRSYIINKNYVETTSGNVTNTRIKLHSIDNEIPVSRAKVSEIRQLQKV